MWKSLAIFFVIPVTFALSSCVGPETQDTPGNAIINSYTALSHQDSLAYLDGLAREKREVYEAIPAAAHLLLGEWSGQRADIKILSVARDNGMATVLYNLRVTGREPLEQDSLIAHAYLEEDGWKYGY